MLRFLSVFFFIVIASTLIYILSLHDALPICVQLAVLDDEPALDTQPLHLLDHVPSERVIPHPGDHAGRSEEHTSELQSRGHLVCRLLLEKKNKIGVILQIYIKQKKNTY